MSITAVAALTALVDDLQQRVKNIEEKPREQKTLVVGGGGTKTKSFTELVDTIADAQALQFLLLDGSRTMTGALNIGEIAKGITFGSANAYIQGETWFGQHVIRLVSEDEFWINANVDFSGQYILRSYFLHYPGSDAAANFYFNPQDAPSKTSWIKLRNPSWNWETLVSMIADVDGACRFEINRAGNITMLADKFIQLGNDAAGLVCNAANRGKLKYVAGAAGVKDQVEVCAKDTADAYAWRVVY